MSDPTDRHIQALMQRASSYLAQSNTTAAIEILKQVLGVNPNLAGPHTLLAFLLLDQNRLHAARHEARLGLELDPESDYAHRGMGAVAVAMRKFKLAREHLQQAIQLDPENPDNRVALARLLRLEGDLKQARVELDQALVLDPENADTLVALAHNCLDLGQLDEAERFANEALEAETEHAAALVLRGHVHLRKGNLEAARDHAIWVLSTDPSRREALLLMAHVKARANPFIGLWWRFSVWLGELGNQRTILVLLGAYLAQRVASIYARENEMPTTSDIISYLWLAVCVYSWVGPGLFHNVVKKELETVKLRHF